MDCLTFHVNGRPTTVRDVSPTTTLLQYLRGPMGLCGTKEGCAEGDCGACTVVMLDTDAPGGPRWRAVNSCLLLLPLVHGRQIFTVEGLRTGPDDDGLHPAQRALADALGSQCGYCTPGVVMSMVEACHRTDLDAAWKLDDQMCGNLCRCTGYRPIREATAAVAGLVPADRLADAARTQSETPPPAPTPEVAYTTQGSRGTQRVWIPTDWAALFDILDRHPEHRFVQGATDLGLEVTKRRHHHKALIALQGLADLRVLRIKGSRWTVGAGVKLADLEDATDYALPPLSRMLRFFGSRQIKNSATVGGNVCNASPIGDLAPVFVALDATFVAKSRDAERPIPARDFFTGYRTTALQSGELLARIEFDSPGAEARFATYKVSKRREMDISAVSAALRVHVDGTTITDAWFAYGGMAATVGRATQAEAAAIGAPWSAETMEVCAQAVAGDFTPLDDHRGSAWYRRTLSANLLRGFYFDVEHDPMPRLADRPSATVLGGVRA